MHGVQCEGGGVDEKDGGRKGEGEMIIAFILKDHG
jgi:hypothetical protein